MSIDQRRISIAGMGNTRYRQFQEIVFRESNFILCALLHSWVNIPFNQSEPEIIRQYLLDDGIPFLNDAISHRLSRNGFEIKFVSVYIHQKPRITRLPREMTRCHSNRQQCELGDLLVIFSFMDRNKRPVINRAFLSQAKKDFVIDNQCQRCLYDSDIEFTMPAYLNGASRYFPRNPRQRYQSLKYLIIRSPHDVNLVGSPWNQIRSTPWACSILSLMLGSDGLLFTNAPNGGRHWSRIIWDLINVVGPSRIRGTGPLRSNTLQFIADQFNDFREYGKFSLKYDGSDKEGIPMLLIFVKDNELQ